MRTPQRRRGWRRPAPVTTRALAPDAALRRARARRLRGAVVIFAVVTAYPADAGEYSPELDFLGRINELRAQVGVVPLAVDRSLEKVAHDWAAAMARAGTISHNPELSTLVDGARKVAENVGIGPSVAAIQQAFERSEGHRTNLVDPELRTVGVGTVFDRGSLWVVQDFKAPARWQESPGPRPTSSTTSLPSSTAPPTVPPDPAAERGVEVRSVAFASEFETFSAEGVASGAQTWGRSQFAAAPATFGRDGKAQLVDVAPGAFGGIWFEVPVTGGAVYVQTIDLQIVNLHPGGRVEMILEWFDASSTLIGYRLTPIVEASHGLATPQQTVQAPPEAASVRFVVNVAGGGSYVVDNARLEAVSVAGSGG